jgi:stearoyl-CoA desaturase (delta-9 desaturase)
MASPAAPIPSALPDAVSPAAVGTPGRPRRAGADGYWSTQTVLSRLFYWGIHAGCLLAFWTGVSALDLALCLGLLYLRMFGITAGYHRYFAHRSYRTSRVFQFLLALLGTTAVQKGPLWWAAGHRRHHRYSDQPGDMHSPREGFWWSHTGWIFSTRWDRTEIESIRDFARYPELLWLNRWHVVPPAALAVLCYAVGGLSGLVWGFAISTTLLWHLTYSINSLAHRWGTQRYPTSDDSRNNWLLGILTMGEGWHNNHHHYMASVRQGFFWWEVDLTYYVLRGLACIGLVRDLREPPSRILRT